ncbi:hypothetical protein D4R52_02855 [bacterium]|nr:MAG: hypothetical protein D4R52_02855 [bacterium]
MPATERINVFAKTNFRNREVSFGIKTDDRRRHVYIIGKTGMGKTTMIENMILQDILAGNGVAFVDPHGESVEKILNYIPSSRINDVVYFNPADLDFPIAFNPLESVDPKYKHLVASGLMGVFTKIWENVWSARMEYILNNTILALLDTPGNTMLGIARMLVDKKFRKKIVDNVKDPVVKSFWVDEFANYNDKFRNEAIAPIQNKVGQFISSAIIRNIVGQPKSKLDLREIMDSKKILLLNLSKGRIGEDNSALLGAMFITKLQLAAMSRVDVLEADRQDFYLYVDEFQNFATESFATILSEARKYRLNLIIAHQYIEQLDEEVVAAVFGNVGTLLTFRVGATDAEVLEKEFEPVFMMNDLVNLTKYHIYLKLMINGTASQPFSAVTLPPLADKTGSEENVIKVTRERYSRPRVEIEEKITRWMGQEYYQEAALQDLTEEDEERERGGVIFTKQPAQAPAPVAAPAVQQQMPRPQEERPRPAPVQTQNPKPFTRPADRPANFPRPYDNRERVSNNPRLQIPHQAPPPAKPKPNPIWDQVAQDNLKKTDETAKKVSKALVFRFGQKKEEAPPVPEPVNPPQTQPRTAKEMLSGENEQPPQPEPQKPTAPQDRKPMKPGESVKF